MNKAMHVVGSLLLLAAIFSQPKLLHAADGQLTPSPTQKKTPLITPTQPKLNAKAYLLVDVNSGKIIAEQQSEEKLPPASLTKMMTLYVISKALHEGQIHLTDSIHVSESAWKTGGSRMFIKEGQDVLVEDLLKGIIVDSGNDACVAMAEHIGGSEQGFADIMNQEAKRLGMNHSHFTDSTGLPNEDLYTTAKDLAILARALIKEFPEYYHWYKQKWFTYNDIRQPNRNRLLWRDAHVDGIKTGYTSEAGYCLASSAKKGDMRLISIVLGSPTDTARADDSERLLNYGFRFYETHRLYESGKTLTMLSIYKGTENKIPVGVMEDQYVTIPTGQYQHLSIKTETPKYLSAPIEKGQQVGELVISFNGQVVSTYPLHALKSVPPAGLFSRASDSVVLTVKQWFS